MISGADVVIYSKNAGADRAFFRDVLGFQSVDAGHGWLVFALPLAEAAFHPSDENGRQLLPGAGRRRSEEHTSELQSRLHLVCRLLLEKKKLHAHHDRSDILDR